MSWLDVRADFSVYTYTNSRAKLERVCGHARIPAKDLSRGAVLDAVLKIERGFFFDYYREEEIDEDDGRIIPSFQVDEEAEEVFECEVWNDSKNRWEELTD